MLLGMHVFALDAAMPFDFEHKATQTLKKQRALTIAILGFGTFGQFLAKRLVAAGHQVRHLVQCLLSAYTKVLFQAFLYPSLFLGHLITVEFASDFVSKPLN